MTSSEIGMTSSEISEHMTENDARLITGYLRNLIASVTEKIDEIGKQLTAAYDRRAWVALGYESWDAYVSAELRTDRLRLDRDDRQDLVVQLRSAGMSTRAIGAAVGASDGTVRNDLRDSTAQDYAVDQPESVRSLDGRERPATQPPRAGPPPTPPSGQTPRAQDELPDEDAESRPVEDGAPAPSVTPTRDLGDVLEERLPGSRADMQRTALSARWSKLMHAVAEFDLLDLDDVRSAIDDTEASLAIKTLRGVAERLEKAGRPGLRVVGGTDA